MVRRGHSKGAASKEGFPCQGSSTHGMNLDADWARQRNRIIALKPVVSPYGCTDPLRLDHFKRKGRKF